MVTLVPVPFFNPAEAREAFSEVAALGETDRVKFVTMPQYEAVLLYSISEGEDDNSLPEMFYILRDLQDCADYNKILASWTDGVLHLAIAAGGSLLLANEYKAPDFTTAEYFIFLALKSLQLNPEVSTICFRGELDSEDEMSLYRYFKNVEQVCG